MIRVWFAYHNPVCDGCGHMLASEKDDTAAEAAMRADGWIRQEGKDLCRLCQRELRETGRLPDKRIIRRKES